MLRLEAFHRSALKTDEMKRSYFHILFLSVDELVNAEKYLRFIEFMRSIVVCQRINAKRETKMFEAKYRLAITSHDWFSVLVSSRNSINRK